MQNDLYNFCTANGITVVAFAPLGSPDKSPVEGVPVLRENPVVEDIAQRLGVAPTQVKSQEQYTIRFALEVLVFLPRGLKN